MRVFMNNSTKDDSIRFFKHQYRINARSISRKQQLRMRNENIKLWGSSTVPWCGYADDLILFMIAIHSLQNEPQPLELQLFLIKYLLIMVFVSTYQKQKQWF